MKRITGFALALAMTAAAAAACSSSSAGDGVDTIQKGVLTVALSPDFPPMEYLDNQSHLIGADVDLATEMAKRMGLRAEFKQQSFDQLIVSTRTGRADVAFSGMSDTVDRRKTVDFVDYFKSVGRLYVLSANAGKVKTNTDICGMAVAVSAKTDYYTSLQDLSAKQCQAAGKPAVNIITADSGAAARLQLDQGRAQVAVQGAENLAFFAQTDKGKYTTVGEPLTNTPFGVAVRKGSDALEKSIVQALGSMYQDGTTKKITTKYNVGYGPVAPALNGAK